MLHSVVFLQFCLIILERIKIKYTYIVPLIAIAAIKYQFTLHSAPFGIEYLPFDLFSWTGIMQIFAGLFASVACFAKPETSRAVIAIFIAAIQILRAADWFNLYVGIEIMLIATVLFTDWKNRYNYLCQQILASTLIIFGICQVYVQQNNFQIMHDSTGLAQIIMLIGFAMKSGFWPFAYQLELYKNAPNVLFLILTCINSKIMCYCMSLCSNTWIFYDAICALSLIFVVYKSFTVKNISNKTQGKQIDDLNLCTILASNATLLILFKYANNPITITYAAWSIVAQFVHCFAQDYFAWIFVPLGPDFLLKIILLKFVPLWLSVPLGLSGCAINLLAFRAVYKKIKLLP